MEGQHFGSSSLSAPGFAGFGRSERSQLSYHQEHQGRSMPYNKQTRPVEEERTESEFSEEQPMEEDEQDDDSDMEDDQKRLVEERAYQKFLPEVKSLVQEVCGNEKPNLVTDRGEKSCAVCPTTQWFKGWKALLAHAGQFKKKRPQHHRGYHRALLEALRVNEKPQEDEDHTPGRAVSINPEVTKSHLIVWPPVVIIQTIDTGKELSERASQFLSEEFPNLHRTKILPVPERRSFIVFEASAVGYLEAKLVGNWLAERRRGRDHFKNDLAWNKRQDSREDRRLIKEDRQLPLYGYLAEPEDMRISDPGKTIVKDWTEESYYEKVQSAQRKSKQEHDKEQAMLKAMELQVENLTEDEQKFKTNKQHIERLITLKQKEIEDQKRRGEKMEQRYLEAVQRLDHDFQTEMKTFEAVSTAKVKRLREQLEVNETRLEEERSKRTKEVESLQKQFRALTEDHKEKEARKALDRELEAMQKRQNFMAEMKKAEAVFNQQARKQESSLQEQQHTEMMELLEEAKQEREQLLKEWLEKQETIKKQGLEAKKLKEQLQEEAPEQMQECAVCMDALTEDTRAVLKPCGHAKFCMECAKGLYDEKRTCPICRQPIEGKPINIPKKLYM